MHFVFLLLCKTSRFLLQHAIEINIGDKCFNSFVYVDEFYGNNSSTNIHIHFYHQFAKNS